MFRNAATDMCGIWRILAQAERAGLERARRIHNLCKAGGDKEGPPRQTRSGLGQRQ